MEEGIDRHALGERIAAARRERGLHQKDLAERLGVSLRSVQLYEAGESSGIFRHLDQIGQMLGHSSAWFLYGERDTSPAELDVTLTALKDRLDSIVATLGNVERLLLDQRELSDVRQRLAALEDRFDGPI